MKEVHHRAADRALQATNAVLHRATTGLRHQAQAAAADSAEAAAQAAAASAGAAVQVDIEDKIHI